MVAEESHINKRFWPKSYGCRLVVFCDCKYESDMLANSEASVLLMHDDCVCEEGSVLGWSCKR